MKIDFIPILERITPSQEEISLIESSTEELVSYLEKAGLKSGVKVDVVPGGSTAKGTFLKGDFDVDIFVRFKTDEKNLSDILELMLGDFIEKNNLLLERVHGSRDYFNFEFNKFFFEIVPVKYIENIADVDNVTDMSPLHVFWVKKHLNEDLKKDIRLAKQFCKAIGVYGAESYINGISGHVLDILVIYYGGFINFLNEVSKWSGVTVIDPENKHKNVFSSLNQSKLVSPLIVIDPIDPQRNAAAAVSNEKYVKLIESVKKYLETFSEEYFIIPKFDANKLIKHKESSEDLFIIEVVPQFGKKDVVITKVLKIFEFLTRHLALYDFDVRLSDWMIDKTGNCYLYFFIDNEELSPTLDRQGPPIENSQAVEKFKEVHESTFEKEGRLYVTVKRDFTLAETCLKHLLSQQFVTERVLSVTMKSF